MDHDGTRRRRRVAWRAGGLPLPRRLATAAAGLLAAGAVVIVLAGGAATREQLTRQAGRELRGYALQLARHPFLLTPYSQDAAGTAGLAGPAGAEAAPLSIEVRGAGGQLVLQAGPAHLARAGLHAAAAGGLANRGRPGPVRAGRGGRFLSIVQPIRYRAHRIPYAYSAQDFAVDVTSPAGTGSPGTLVLHLSLGRISRGTGRLTVTLLAVSGLLVAAAAALAAGTVRVMLRPPGRAAGPAAGAGQPPPRVTAQMAAAVARTSRELRTPLSVLDGLADYYRHRDQPGPGDFDRLLARVATETTRIAALIDALERAGQDRGPDDGHGPDPDPGRPQPWLRERRENVGGGA